MPVIGVDFDNTLVSYDALFWELALERSLISPETDACKQAVRDAVRQLEAGEIRWQKLQAEAYGPSMHKARIIPGVRRFLALCKKKRLPVSIVSHKTRRAAQDTTGTDLRAMALSWMTQHGFFDDATSPLRKEDVHFESTREKKIERIQSIGCDVFIDDLPELFLTPSFPADVRKILFAKVAHPDCDCLVLHDWNAIIDELSRLNG